ncbi:MAG: hypothetical protein L0Z50_04600 [Verrucomicrobiales bacterium]|nr:hypothetical protein [Verrucomicrobiales bacterium]
MGSPENSATLSSRPLLDYYGSTRWSLIDLAGQDSEESIPHETLQRAWYDLVQQYEGPIAAQINQRFSGRDPENLVEEFIATPFQELVRTADASKGRFRDFLAGALRHFINDHLRKLYTKKRGEGKVALSLEEQAEKGIEPGVAMETFTYALASSIAEKLFANVFAELRQEYVEKELKRLERGLSRAEALQAFEMFIGQKVNTSVADIAKFVKKTPGAVKTERCRLKNELILKLRNEVAELVRTGFVDEELNYILGLLELEQLSAHEPDVAPGEKRDSKARSSPPEAEDFNQGAAPGKNPS